MDKEPSISAAFRAMVMLGGLLALPAVALFGTGLAETLKQIVQRHLGVNTAAASSMADVHDLEAGGLRDAAFAPLAPPTVAIPQTSVAGGGTCDAASRNSMLPAGPGQVALGTVQAALVDKAPVQAAATAAVPAAVPAGLPDAGFVAAGFLATVPAAAEPAQAVQAVGLQRSVYEVPANLVPVSLPEPLVEASATAKADRGGAAATGDEFSRLQARLRELGSTYCVLESWGSQAELYRFFCRMAVGGNVHYTRCFEAVDRDPLTALSRVVDEVEAWRAGGTR